MRRYTTVMSKISAGTACQRSTRYSVPVTRTVTSRVWGLPVPLRARLSFRLRPVPLYVTPAQVSRRVRGSSSAERTSTAGVQAEKLSASLLKSNSSALKSRVSRAVSFTVTARSALSPLRITSRLDV